MLISGHLKSLTIVFLIGSFCLSLSAQETFFEIKVPEVAKEERICFCLYTVEKGVLKLTAQLYPLQAGEPRQVSLEIKQRSKWKPIAQATVHLQGWTAVFRVEDWDATRDIHYRVNHNDCAYYTGVIKKDPVDKEQIVVAAFTGNSIYPQHGGDISREDIVNNIKFIKPDLLFFSGDQVYDHTRHYAYWLKFGRDFGEVIKNIPTVTIPDDHDVGQGNLWGSSGKKSSGISGDDGGYFMPVEYVKEVERVQTSHLPDPYDPTPVQQGIGTYYTSLNVGGIDFAILEDRKFKTGWREVLDETLVEPDAIIGTMRPHSFVTDDYDPSSLDVPEAKLLGECQLRFLRHWALDWDRSVMKCVLSQTCFCDSADRYYEPERRRYVDFDCNGWPQAGRNKALIEMRKCFAFHINGDTHLGTVFQHGVTDWNDAAYSFTVPSIANLYMRWWTPDQPGKNRVPGSPEYTGEHLDGFGNKVTCWGAANPSFKADPRNPEFKKQLTVRAAGFGVVRFNKKTRKITMECWPRNVDVAQADAKQYPDWPLTIDQTDNYGRHAIAYLPTLRFTNTEDPVVRIVDASNGEHVYTLRAKGRQFQPKVFKFGLYTITISQGERQKQIEHVEANKDSGNEVIDVTL